MLTCHSYSQRIWFWLNIVIWEIRHSSGRIKTHHIFCEFTFIQQQQRIVATVTRLLFSLFILTFSYRTICCALTKFHSNIFYRKGVGYCTRKARLTNVPVEAPDWLCQCICTMPTLLLPYPFHSSSW